MIRAFCILEASNHGKEMVLSNSKYLSVRKKKPCTSGVETMCFCPWLRSKEYTSKFVPREVIVGSVAISAASQSFMALCRSFRWPHLGCLRSPAMYTENVENFIMGRHSDIKEPNDYGIKYLYLQMTT